MISTAFFAIFRISLRKRSVLRKDIDIDFYTTPLLSTNTSTAFVCCFAQRYGCKIPHCPTFFHKHAKPLNHALRP